MAERVALVRHVDVEVDGGSEESTVRLVSRILVVVVVVENEGCRS